MIHRAIAPSNWVLISTHCPLSKRWPLLPLPLSSRERCVTRETHLPLPSAMKPVRQEQVDRVVH